MKALLLLAFLPSSAFALGFAQVHMLNGKSTTQSILTSAIDVSQIVNSAIQASWDNGTTGVITIEASNDIVYATPYGPPSPENWTTPSSATATANGAGNALFNFANLGWHWVRLRFAPAIGSAGTISAVYDGKN